MSDAGSDSDPTPELQPSIRIDFGNVTDAAVGEHGLSGAMLEALEPDIEAAVKSLAEARARGELAWRELPHERQTLEDIREKWQRQRGRFTDLVLLGIGGSALGPLALQAALKHPQFGDLDEKGRDGAPRLHVLDNVDPVRVAGLLDVLPLETTLFNVISKSGTTVETMAQFLLIHRMLVDRFGSAGAVERIVCTTDPEKGRLREICDREGFESFAIPAGVGGRFSILTAVGLFPAVALEIDCDGLLDGAAAMDERTGAGELWSNPAAFSAAVLYLAATRRGQNIHVFMPYSHGLGTFAEWYAQLWAESLGKRVDRSGAVVNVGQTPVKAVGVTDQHSQVQLYVEGPYDKIVTFLAVERPGCDLTLPAGAFGDLEGVGYLGGQSLSKLFEVERIGTELALTAAGRPNYTIYLPEVSAHTVGQLIVLLEVQTAIAGELYQVNAYDQPGVEAGKVAAYAMMGRAGFEERRREIESRPARDERYII